MLSDLEAAGLSDVGLNFRIRKSLCCGLSVFGGTFLRLDHVYLGFGDVFRGRCSFPEPCFCGRILYLQFVVVFGGGGVSGGMFLGEDAVYGVCSPDYFKLQISRARNLVVLGAPRNDAGGYPKYKEALSPLASI